MLTKTKPRIENGVGRFSAPANHAMTYIETMEFIEQYCINSELYQDIKLLCDKHYDDHVKSMRHFLSAKSYFFVTRMAINDPHQVMTIQVIAHRRPCGPGTYFQYREAGAIHVSLNADGLITDILKERPKMNPGMNRTVINRKL